MSGRIEDRLNEFGALPELAPPVACEVATLSAMARASAGQDRDDSTRSFAMAASWFVAIGAGVLLAVWTLKGNEPGVSPEMPLEIDQFYTLLVEESMRLEELLALMPEPRRIIRGGTASTIVGLEDRIALIDAELDRAGISTNIPEYRAALMLDRVEVMNALVNVRYAQSRAFVF